MKKKKDIIIFTSSCLVVGVVLFFITRNYNTLPEFTADAVESIVLDSAEDGDKKIEDVETFIKYYNQIYDVEDNLDGDILGPDYILNIKLKSGEAISMMGLARGLEIIVHDKEKNSKEYLGKQKELQNLVLYGEY